MKTAVVILNWNTKDYLSRFVPLLLDSLEGMDAGLWVVDNASTDGSAELVASEFPTVGLIRFEDNYGFTGGYNRALAQIAADYYVLINSDVEVPRGWLGPLVEWMDAHSMCGACGPKLLSYSERDAFEYAGAAGGLLDRYGLPFCRGRVFKTIEKDHGQYDSPASVLWVSGACLMVRAGLWHELGGLDERFFAHMEEIDLCWRMQLSGYSVDVVPASFVYHIGGGTLPASSPRKLYFNYRNNLLLLQNNLAATFKAAHPSWSASRCHAKAGWRLFVRMLLDGAFAFVYLVTGRWKAFGAVLRAHNSFRALSRRPDISAQGPATVHGLSRRCMLLG
jgi:GT2 family glycosyltransferase